MHDASSDYLSELQLMEIAEAITLRSSMSNTNRSVSASTRFHNRVGAIMLHINRYCSRGTSRLAADIGVAKSTISHLVHGQTIPLYSTANRVVKALSFQLGFDLDPDEVFSEDGKYPTPFVCKLVGCRGCLPVTMFEAEGDRKAEFRGFKPGTWSGDCGEFRFSFGEDNKKGGS